MSLRRGAEARQHSLWIPSAEACELQPAATTHARFHIERRSVRVRVLHADGRTPSSDRCFLATHTFFLPACRNDADGWLTLDPAPAGPFTLQFAVEQGPSNWQPSGKPSGLLELPADHVTGSLTVCMPD